jgi:hypothetical protein
MFRSNNLGSLKNNGFFLLVPLLLLAVSIGICLVNSSTAHAGFNAGRIIDDPVFTNANSMTAAQIQSFLESKNSACLKNFKSQSLTDDNGDGQVQDWSTEPYGLHGEMTAAQLIKSAAVIYKLNPQVLLATLEKEQGLITRQDCPAWRYNTAFGYGCPDTAPCDNAAYGFTRQIDNAAYHFRGYFDDSLRYVPFGVGTYNISYNPAASCGSSPVGIQNRATASLYSYTPYQPNAAALNAAPGQVVDCGAYGNINFWRYFNNWFGATTTECQGGEQLLPQVQRLYNPATNTHFYSALQCEINMLTQKYGFRVDGAAFNVSFSPSLSIPVYRLYNVGAQRHFWTTSPAERDATIRAGFQYEGAAFTVLDPASGVPAAPVYRLYNPASRAHFWTLYPSEADSVARNSGYRAEGPAFYSQ